VIGNESDYNEYVKKLTVIFNLSVIRKGIHDGVLKKEVYVKLLSNDIAI